jgi:hypothetical protein
MIKFLSRFSLISILNYFLIIFSRNMDFLQVTDDLGNIFFLRGFKYNTNFIIFLICISSTLIALAALRVFKPFMEIYLLFYMKINFYFFITLLSLSTTYLIFRIYGYSRLLIVIYLCFASAVLLFTDKFLK